MVRVPGKRSALINIRENVLESMAAVCLKISSSDAPAAHPWLAKGKASNGTMRRFLRFFPLALRLLKRPQTRLCAFRALSLTCYARLYPLLAISY
jgi:hypothetical protein